MIKNESFRHRVPLSMNESRQCRVPSHENESKDKRKYLDTRMNQEV